MWTIPHRSRSHSVRSSSARANSLQRMARYSYRLQGQAVNVWLRRILGCRLLALSSTRRRSSSSRSVWRDPIKLLAVCTCLLSFYKTPICPPHIYLTPLTSAPQPREKLMESPADSNPSRELQPAMEHRIQPNLQPNILQTNPHLLECFSAVRKALEGNK